MPPRSSQFQEQGIAVAGDRPSIRHQKKETPLSPSKVNNKVREHGTPSTANSLGRRSIPAKDIRRTMNDIKKGYGGTKKYSSLSNNCYDYILPEDKEQVKQQQAGGSITNDHEGLNTTSTNINPYNSVSSYPGGYGYGSSAGMMMMPPIYPGGGMGPFSGIYQVLYGVQNVVLSVTQAVQLVGMNQQLLQQAWESISHMIDHASATFYEMRALEQQQQQQQNNREETEKVKQHQRRLKALRYALVFGGSWLTYKMVRAILFHARDKRRLLTATPGPTNNNLMGSFLGRSAMSPYTLSNYSNGMGYGGPPSHMYNGMFSNNGSGYPAGGYY
jgi:hypothetical protein